MPRKRSRKTGIAGLSRLGFVSVAPISRRRLWSALMPIVAWEVGADDGGGVMHCCGHNPNRTAPPD